MLSIAPVTAARFARAPAESVRFHVVDGASSRRPAVEAFIRGVYAMHYGAHVTTWKPTLVCNEQDGHIHAAAGYRAAGDEPLFLERYLDCPIEVALAAATGATVFRDHIVEVGHFASMRAGAGKPLMIALGHHLIAQGFRWVVSTATQELRTIFTRMRIAPIALAAADPRVLGDAATTWGSYYDHAPLVMAGEILPNLSRFGALERA